MRTSESSYLWDEWYAASSDQRTEICSPAGKGCFTLSSFPPHPAASNGQQVPRNGVAQHETSPLKEILAGGVDSLAPVEVETIDVTDAELDPLDDWRWPEHEHAGRLPDPGPARHRQVPRRHGNPDPGVAAWSACVVPGPDGRVRGRRPSAAGRPGRTYADPAHSSCRNGSRRAGAAASDQTHRSLSHPGAGQGPPDPRAGSGDLSAAAATSGPLAQLLAVVERHEKLEQSRQSLSDELAQVRQARDEVERKILAAQQDLDQATPRLAFRTEQQAALVGAGSLECGLFRPRLGPGQGVGSSASVQSGNAGCAHTAARRSRREAAAVAQMFPGDADHACQMRQLEEQWRGAGGPTATGIGASRKP